jgi:hypothetical protein
MTAEEERRSKNDSIQLIVKQHSSNRDDISKMAKRVNDAYKRYPTMQAKAKHAQNVWHGSGEKTRLARRMQDLDRETYKSLSEMKKDIDEEIARRQGKYDLTLNVKRTDLVLLGQPDMTIMEMKEMIEETFFEIGSRTIPGPSARSIYALASGKLPNNEDLMSLYADEDHAVTFNVSPETKRTREAVEENAKHKST